MQRLMHVANEVEEEFEGDDLLFKISGGIREFDGEFLDLIDDA